MKDEWTRYLESIGIKEHFLKRTEEVIGFYQQLYPDQIEDIFVTEYLDKEGNRKYESLWLFSKTSMMEAKQFLTLTQEDFDFSPFKNQVIYWNIQKTEYNFQKASNNSRMVLTVTLASKIGGEFKASKENCDHLKEIFLKYIIPNA